MQLSNHHNPAQPSNKNMSTSQSSPKERAARFLGRLRAIRTDRGKMAALRRGLSPATVMTAWPVVADLGGDIGPAGESPWVEIAALFATHPEESNARNFGESCRALALTSSTDRTLPESDQRRFRRLLACGDVADLSTQLRSWVRLASSKGVSVNYEYLLADILNWPNYSDDIRVKWARSFWQSGEAPAASNPQPTTP